MKNKLPSSTISVVASVAILAMIPASFAAAENPRCIDVIDGDTLRIEGLAGVAEVHLWGIDAPELDQPWGAEARDTLVGLARDRHLELIVRGGQGDTTQATVSVSGIDLSGWLAEHGFAWLPEFGSTSDDYATKIVIARSSRLGVWSDDKPVHPAVWRARAEEARRAAGRATGQPSLSDIAGAIDIADETVIRDTPTTPAPPTVGGSVSSVSSVPLALPDSPYGTCIHDIVARLLPRVETLRSALADNSLSQDESERAKLEHDCGIIEELHQPIGDCSDVMRGRESLHFRDADWEISSTVSGYGFACRYAVVHENVGSALEAMATADSDFRKAQGLFIAGVEDAAQDAASRERNGKWPP